MSTDYLAQPPRLDTLFGVAVDDWHQLWMKAQELNVPVRDLPTAIVAAMPCYYSVASLGTAILDATQLGVRMCESSRFTNDPCPSCTARKEVGA